MQTITIKWHGPFKPEKVLNHNLTFEKGIYMISRVWGNTEKLVYIGKTKNEFYKRLENHSYWLDEYRGKLKILLGLIELGPNMKF